MRILYVTGCMPYGTGEAFIIEEIRELLRYGHEVLVVPRSPVRKLIQADDLAPFTIRESLLSRRVLRAAISQPGLLAGRWSRVMRSGFRTAIKNAAVVPKSLWLASLARDRNVDHIHCHWAGTTATIAMFAAEISGIPWSFTAHRSDIVSNNLLPAKVESAQFARVISHDGFAMMLARGVRPDPKMRVLHMGVRIPARTAAARPEPPVVLCPADFLAVKGHSYLLAAWKNLESRGVPGELWLAGRGQPGRSLQQAMAGCAGVKCLGVLKHSELLDLYRRGAISAVVLASIDLGNGEHEGIPVALMEAMSFGVPVIATSTGGIPELVSPGAGLLVRERDPEALAGAIEQVTANPVLARNLGQAGRRRVAEAFNVTHIARELENCFQATSRLREAQAPC